MSAGYMRRCTGKRRHEDRDDAERARLTLQAKVGRAMSAYRCDQCLGYHVGKPVNAMVTRVRRSGKRPNKRLRGRV